MKYIQLPLDQQMLHMTPRHLHMLYYIKLMDLTGKLGEF